MKKEKGTVEVFSRVTGFFRPVQSWNKGKTEEFKDRKEYTMEILGAGCRCSETFENI